MKKLNNSNRKTHRKVLQFLILLITLISETAYIFLETLGVDAFWLIKLHTYIAYL